MDREFLPLRAKKQGIKCLAVDVYVGQRIQALRSTLKISVETIAPVIKVSAAHFLAIEAGTTRATAGETYDIAAEMKSSISYFFDGFGGGGRIQATPTTEPAAPGEGRHAAQ